MLTIFSDAMRTATRQDHWDAPRHWQKPRPRPITDYEAKKIEQERRRRQFNAMFWL